MKEKKLLKIQSLPKVLRLQATSIRAIRNIYTESPLLITRLRHFSRVEDLLVPQKMPPRVSLMTSQKPAATRAGLLETKVVPSVTPAKKAESSKDTTRTVSKTVPLMRKRAIAASPGVAHATKATTSIISQNEVRQRAFLSLDMIHSRRSIFPEPLRV
jgi:hypothetical protein